MLKRLSNGRMWLAIVGTRKPEINYDDWKDYIDAIKPTRIISGGAPGLIRMQKGTPRNMTSLAPSICLNMTSMAGARRSRGTIRLSRIAKC